MALFTSFVEFARAAWRSNVHSRSETT